MLTEKETVETKYIHMYSRPISLTPSISYGN